MCMRILFVLIIMYAFIIYVLYSGLCRHRHCLCFDMLLKMENNKLSFLKKNNISQIRENTTPPIGVDKSSIFYTLWKISEGFLKSPKDSAWLVR